MKMNEIECWESICNSEFATLPNSQVLEPKWHSRDEVFPFQVKVGVLNLKGFPFFPHHFVSSSDFPTGGAGALITLEDKVGAKDNPWKIAGMDWNRLKLFKEVQCYLFLVQFLTLQALANMI